jgi:hypothetical protein
MLYLLAIAFDSGSGYDQPEGLVRHTGHIGQVSVAFAANGLVHFSVTSASCATLTLRAMTTTNRFGVKHAGGNLD